MSECNFKRNLTMSILQKLKQEKLYQDKLLPDIKSSAVFPAIRNDEISFYYKGRNLFRYNKTGFATHYKYGVVPVGGKTYVLEKDLQNFNVMTSFYDAYENIKKQSELYTHDESEGLSVLYKYSGIQEDSSVVLLDIEVDFTGKDDSDEKNRNRIDLLLFDMELKRLCFCEAKHYSNNEIWAVSGSKPKVCDQIKKYNEQIKVHADIIVKQYQNYIDGFNELFETNLPYPEGIFPQTGLLIFGFDANQKSKIDELLISDGSLDGINHYAVGGLKSEQIKTLYKTITK